jgi:hypothetical protein
MNNHLDLEEAITLIDIDKINELLQDENIDELTIYTSAFLKACECQHLEIIKLLMNHPRIDPSIYDNNAIKYFFNHEINNDVINILWQDQRVKDKLKNNDLNMYNDINEKIVNEKINGF